MPDSDFKRFEKATRAWLVRFGLSDWTVAVDAPKEPAEDSRSAGISYNTSNRKACISWYGNREVKGQQILVHVQPEDHALHEVLHLALGDLMATTSQKGDRHEDSVREEHKLIERMIGAFNAKR